MHISIRVYSRFKICVTAALTNACSRTNCPLRVHFAAARSGRRKDHDSISHDLPEATSVVKLRELGSAHFFERTADSWRRIHRIQCHDLLVHRYPKRRRVVGGTYRWRNHRCSRCDCFASDVELALGLDTACGRLGRLSHLLVPLVIREGRVVSAPNKRMNYAPSAPDAAKQRRLTRRYAAKH